jgi:hypothetical protein
VFDGTTQIGVATTNANGAWSLATGTLSAAVHSFTARAVDAAGNTSGTSSALNVTVAPGSTPTPSGANLLVNGSFEASTVRAGNWAGFDAVAGWTALSGGQIELWNALNGVTATNGSNFGELDYLAARDGFYQTVQTTAGQRYTLSFDARSRAGVSAATTTIEVLWNDTVVATVPPGTDWSTYNFSVTGTGGADRLTFREAQSQSADGLGALYDNISLVASTTAPADTVAPAAPRITAFSPDTGTVGDGVTTASTVTLIGTAEAGSIVAVFDGTTQIGVAAANASGAWTLSTGTLSAAVHSFTARAADAAGNVSAASAALTMTVMPGSTSDGSNLLVNGSFEESTVRTGNWAGFGTVAGWTALNGGQIELWNTLNGVTATNGSNFGELDYLAARDGFYQTVTTTAGQRYTLSFDARSRPGFTAATTTIEVLWNDTVVATVPPGTDWSTYNFSVTGTGGADRLTFREAQSQSADGLGALYDNIRLVADGGSTAAASVSLMNQYAAASIVDTGTGQTQVATQGGTTVPLAETLTRPLAAA